MKSPNSSCRCIIAVFILHMTVFAIDVQVSPLHIEGKSIKNERGQTITLKAVNCNDYMEHPYNNWNQPFAPTIEWIHTRYDFFMIKKMGFNCVRLNISPTHIDSLGMKRLKDLLTWAENAGLYAIVAYFAPPGSVYYNGYYSEKQFWGSIQNREKFIAHWESVMGYCSGKSHVIYEWLNEPQIGYTDDTSSPAYSPYSTMGDYTNLCKTLLDYNKTHGNKVVIIDGPGYAAADYRGFNYLCSSLSGYENIVYSFHYYMQDYALRGCNWYTDTDNIFKKDTGFTETNPGWDTIRFNFSLPNQMNNLQLVSLNQSGGYKIRSCSIKNKASGSVLFSFDFAGKNIVKESDSVYYIKDNVQNRRFEVVAGGCFNSALGSIIEYDNTASYVVIKNTVQQKLTENISCWATLRFNNESWNGGVINFTINTPLTFEFILDGEYIDDNGWFSVSINNDQIRKILKNLTAWDKDTLYYKGKTITSHCDRIDAAFKIMERVSSKFNVPVFLGEFGIPLYEREKTTFRYFRRIIDNLSRNNWSWAYFVYREMFDNAVYPDKNNVTFSLFSGFGASVETMAGRIGTQTTNKIGASPYYYSRILIDSLTALLGGVFDPGNVGAINTTPYCAPSRNPAPAIIGLSIKLTLVEKTAVRIDIYALNGVKIKTVCDNTLPSGDHHVCWDGEGYSGNKAAHGVYICRLLLNNSLYKYKITVYRQ